MLHNPIGTIHVLHTTQVKQKTEQMKHREILLLVCQIMVPDQDCHLLASSHVTFCGNGQIISSQPLPNYCLTLFLRFLLLLAKSSISAGDTKTLGDTNGTRMIEKWAARAVVSVGETDNKSLTERLTVHYSSQRFSGGAKESYETKNTRTFG